MILSSDGNTYENQLDFTLAHSPGMSDLSLNSDGPKPTGVQVATNYPPTKFDTSSIPAPTTQDVVGTSKDLAPAAPTPGVSISNAFTGMAKGAEEAVKSLPDEATQLAKSVVSGFTLPHDVAEGTEDPMSEHGIGRAAELAGALIFGPAPIAAKAIDGTLGSIAGVSAKNLDTKYLTLAKMLDFIKFPADEIWSKTGMFKGADGNWRFELPSETAKFNTPEAIATNNNFGKSYEPTTLGKVLDFPDLYKAYPQLENLETTFNFTKGFLGHYHPDEPRINLNLHAIEGTNQDATQVALHEVQHAIQHIEGFSYGTTMKKIAGRFRELMKDPSLSQSKVADVVNDFLSNRNTRESLQEELYNRSPGEREAKLVELRSKWKSDSKSLESPMDTRKRMDNTENTSEYKSKFFPSENLSAYPPP